MRNLKLYCDVKRDYDDSWYYRTKNEVKLFNNEIKQINSILNSYRKKIDVNSGFLLGNKLYFTYNGIKYWDMISDYSNEENYVKEIISKLEFIGCYDVIYKKGYID